MIVEARHTIRYLYVQFIGLVMNAPEDRIKVDDQSCVKVLLARRNGANFSSTTLLPSSPSNLRYHEATSGLASKFPSLCFFSFHFITHTCTRCSHFCLQGLTSVRRSKGFAWSKGRGEKPIPILLLPPQPPTLLYHGFIMPFQEPQDPKVNRNEARADHIIPPNSPEAFPLALSESDR